MWTEGSWSFRFLSALALVLLLACFDRVLDQAPRDSVDGSITQRMGKAHILSPLVAIDEISRKLKKEACGIGDLNLQVCEMTFDHIVSVRSIPTTAARIRRFYAEIHAEQIFQHDSPKRPGFHSGRLVRTLCGRFAGLEQRREGNWN